MTDKEVISYIPTEENKVEALGSVFYEIQQLCYSSQLHSDTGFVKNAFVESTLVHVRVLSDFFEASRRSSFTKSGQRFENDDVIAADYGFPPTPLNIDKQYSERLNKDLVHLSYSRNRRRSHAAKQWPATKVVLPVIVRSVEFIDSLKEEVLKRVSRIPVAEWQKLRSDLAILKSKLEGTLT